MQNETGHIKQDSGRRWRRRLPLWLSRLLKAAVFALVTPILLFQIPWVQYEAARRLTAYLSQELNTTLRVQTVELGLFNKVSLGSFYLEDQTGDTLMYAGNLTVNHSGVFMLLFRQLSIENLRIRDASIVIRQDSLKSVPNYGFLIEYFKKDEIYDPSRQKKPFSLNLKHFKLERIRLRQTDEAGGSFRHVSFRKAEGHFRRFDLEKQSFELSKFALESPDVRMRLGPGSGKAPAPGSPVAGAPSARTDTTRLRLSVQDLTLSGGSFSLRNLRSEPVRTTPPDILNYNYLDIRDIALELRDFSYCDLDFQGEIGHFSLRDSSGFELENLSARQARLSPQGMELYGLELRTPHTLLGDTLVFQYDGYESWQHFVDEVDMRGHFNQASVALKDIMTFAPALEENAFFRENRDEVLEIQGIVEGTVNRLDAKRLQLNLARGVLIQGKFSTFNLAVPDEQFLSLKLDRLQTDVGTLRKLIPGFDPPQGFNSLGNIDFSGKFDGFFVDFVADGKLRTSIGRAEMFMNLKLRDGKEKALYSGDLYLRDFDLGALSGNADLGKVSLNTHVKQGRGLTLNSANARLEGTVDSLVYKGYRYEHVTLNGILQKNEFSGYLRIEDPNINFTFGGAVNLGDSLPAFDFRAEINRLALQPLHISDKDLRLSGLLEFHLVGKRLSDVAGTARLSDFMVVKGQGDYLCIDSALLSSRLVPGDNPQKHFSLQSNLLDLDIKGNFDLASIPDWMTQFLAEHYPAFSSRLGIRVSSPLPDTARFDFQADFFELQHLFQFLDEKIDGFDETHLHGSYDGLADQLFLEVEVPSWQYQDLRFSDVYLRSKMQGPEGSLQVGVVKTRVGEDQELSPVYLIGNLYHDTLEFLLISSNFHKILDNININGILTVDPDSAWRVSFKPSDLVILNQDWKISTSNYLRIGDGLIETNDFVLSTGNQQILLKSLRNEGLEFQLKNYPLDSLDFLKNIPSQRIRGTADLQAQVKDLFRFRGISALLRIDSLQVNGDHYGTLRLDARTASIKESIDATMAIEHDTMSLVLDGFINPPGMAAEAGSRRRTEPGPRYFDFDISISRYPVKIVQYFVPEVLDVRGAISTSNARIYGPLEKPELSGEAQVSQVHFKVKPLQTAYSVPDGKLLLSGTMFDAAGTAVYDRLGNRAFLDGGITHDHLRDFGLNLRIATEKGKGFLGLETTARDNPVFYGTAIGTGYVRFSGSFRQPSLYVNGRTVAGTHMYLPMTSSASTKPQSRFLLFPQDEGEKAAAGAVGNPLELKGLNMEYDLEITPEAVMEVIFDKAWGDVLVGTGNSQLKVIMTREGRFDMYGQFTVVSGRYLFTLMNLGLNKPFVAEPGGTITWNGDPYDATIKINAVYDGLNTSVYSFIQEYLAAASPGAKDLARNGTNVQLKMNLSGRLLQPDIAFDLKFPSLDSELRNFAENKMRSIRQDPNELNRQVFGLLVLGQFLPSGYTIQAGDVGINTLSEMLSNQLSIYLTEFVSEFFTGSSVIKGIDLDISYNRYSAGSAGDPANPATAYTTSELQGRLNVIVNDRFNIRMGGNFDVGGGSQLYTNNSTFLSGDFQVEYVISKDRRLKIKVYNSTEPDFAGGRRNKYGVGLSFRKEFDSIQELMEFRQKKKD